MESGGRDVRNKNNRNIKSLPPLSTHMDIILSSTYLNCMYVCMVTHIARVCIEATVMKRILHYAGRAARMHDDRLPNIVMRGEMVGGKRSPTVVKDGLPQQLQRRETNKQWVLYKQSSNSSNSSNCNCNSIPM